MNYGTVLGSKETSLSLTREVRSFEILIPDAFVSRREGVYNKAFPDCAWQLLSNQRMDVPLSQGHPTTIFGEYLFGRRFKI